MNLDVFDEFTKIDWASYSKIDQEYVPPCSNLLKA